jgi:hypothetical protein
MYGLAERRRRYEIVFKNAKKNSATRCTPGRRKVCGPVAAACNEPEVHVLSPAFIIDTVQPAASMAPY